MTDRDPPSDPSDAEARGEASAPAPKDHGKATPPMSSIVPTPTILTKAQKDKPDPNGPSGGGGPEADGPQEGAGTPHSGAGEGAVILTFPTDRARRPSEKSEAQNGGSDLADLTAYFASGDDTITPRSAEDWQAAARIMADAEAQALRNAELARNSQLHMKAAADAFQRTQATAAEVRKTIAGQSVQGLRDSAARLRATVAWMDEVLGDLQR